MPRKKIDEKTKQGVIEAYRNGKTRKRIAEQFGISLSSVGRIVKEHVPTHGPEKKTDRDNYKERQKRIEDIEKRIAALEKKIFEFEARKMAKRNRF